MVATLGHSDNWVSLLAVFVLSALFLSCEIVMFWVLSVLSFILYIASMLCTWFFMCVWMFCALAKCLFLQFTNLSTAVQFMMSHIYVLLLLPPAVDSVRAI